MAKNERNGRSRRGRSGAGKKEFWGHVPTKDGRGKGTGLVGWDGGTRTAKCRLLLRERASSRAQVRKKGADAALKVEGRIFPSSDIALTHDASKGAPALEENCEK